MESSQNNYSHLLSIIGLKEANLAAIYLRGSHGVGTGTENSDYDYVLITKDKFAIDEYRVSLGLIDFTICDLETFEYDISINEIGMMECMFSKPILLNMPHPADTFKVNKFPLLGTTLRVVRSRRKKWKTSKFSKHLFIAIRYMCYAKEIILNGCIKDIRAYNYIWFEYSEQEREETYKKLKLAIKEEFSKFIPKDENFPGLEPSKLKIVNHVRKFGLKKLFDEHKVEFKRHQDFPNLVQLFYTQNSKNTEEARLSRGIILDQANQYNPVAFPFARFDGEFELKPELKIENFGDYKVFRKYDGIMCILYWYKENWQVAGEDSPDGLKFICKTTNKRITLKEAFWKIFNAKNYEVPTDKEYTHIFELTLELNRIITKEDDDLIYLGSRSIVTYEEKFDVPYTSWKTAEEFKMSFDEMKEFLASRTPGDFEGFVLLNVNDKKRYKLKIPEYKELNNFYPIQPSIKLGSCTRFILERYKKPGFLERFPQFVYNARLLEYKIRTLEKNILNAWENLTEKEWNESGYKYFLFKRKKGYEFEDSFARLAIDKQIKFLDAIQS